MGSSGQLLGAFQLGRDGRVGLGGRVTVLRHGPDDADLRGADVIEEGLHGRLPRAQPGPDLVRRCRRRSDRPRQLLADVRLVAPTVEKGRVPRELRPRR